MDLFHLRQQFGILSGRYDLVEGSPTLVTDLINQGSRYLDRITNHKKSAAAHFTFLDINEYQVSFPVCRTLKEVWVSSLTKKWPLYKKPLQDIIFSYLSSGTIVPGTPSYYAPTLTRSIPEGTDLAAFASYMTTIDVQPNTSYDYSAIVIVPPTSEKLMVDIRGLFYSKELVADTDENYWSASHPFILLQAALRELDIFDQNKTNVELRAAALANSVANIEKDLVYEEIVGVNQMNG
jgi:hypothetical protein